MRIKGSSSIEEIADLLRRSNGSFSWPGALALARLLKEEVRPGEEVELDPDSIARSWTEYDSAREALKDIDIEDRLRRDLDGIMASLAIACGGVILSVISGLVIHRWISKKNP